MTRLNQNTTDWTPERVAALQRYYDEGKSHTEVAELLGKTKHAVIGKSDRLRKHRNLRGAETRYHANVSTTNRVGASTGIVAGFQALRALTCQWLYGEPRDRHFCGAPSRQESSYCEDHHRRCVVGYWTPVSEAA